MRSRHKGWPYALGLQERILSRNEHSMAYLYS